MELKTHLTLIYIALVIIIALAYSIYKTICLMIEHGTHTTVDHIIPKEVVTEIANMVLDEIEKRKNVTDGL